MHIYRVKTSCPDCNALDENWNYKGSFVSENTQCCTACSKIYNSSEYIFSFLELKSDNPISTNQVAAYIRNNSRQVVNNSIV